MKARLKPMQRLWLLVLVAAFALSGAVTWMTSHKMSDSDTASDLLLAHHLYETGQILSKDWYYSTDLRVVHTQLVFAPLFAVLSDWQMVRFVGCMLLQAMMVACYGYFAKRAKLGFSAFCIGGVLMLMPLSIRYGSLVLYHSGYIPHVAMGFALAGLVLAALDDWQGRKKGWLAVHLALLAALSVLSGLNGYRQLAITHAPMALIAVLWLYQAKNKADNQQATAMLIVAGLGIAGGLAGLVGNVKLSQLYTFQDYSGIWLELITAEDFLTMLKGVLFLFGYRQEMMLMTLTGVASVAGVVVALYCVLRSARSALGSPEERGAAVRLADQMLVCGMAVMGLIFLFTSQNFNADTYFLPIVVWYVPLLARAMTTCADNGPLLPRLPAWITGRKLLLYALFGVCLLNGAVNMRSYAFPETQWLTYYDPRATTYNNQAQSLTPVRDFLVQEGYDYGHATFWSANLLTEMSDGELTIAIIDYAPETNGPCYLNWLTVKSYRDLEEVEKPFLLLRQSERSQFEPLIPAGLLNQVYEDGECVVYDVTDLSAWRETLKPHTH